MQDPTAVQVASDTRQRDEEENTTAGEKATPAHGSVGLSAWVCPVCQRCFGDMLTSPSSVVRCKACKPVHAVMAGHYWTFELPVANQPQMKSPLRVFLHCFTWRWMKVIPLQVMRSDAFLRASHRQCTVGHPHPPFCQLSR